MTTELSVIEALPPAVRSSPAIQSFTEEDLGVIASTFGAEPSKEVLSLLSLWDPSGNIREMANVEWDSEEAGGDGTGLSVRYIKVCNKITETNQNVPLGALYYTDPLTDKAVHFGQTSSGWVLLQHHNERRLYPPENVDCEGCASLDAKTGTEYGKCDCCKFNGNYVREMQSKGKKVETLSDGKKDVTCQFQTCIIATRMDTPTTFYQIPLKSASYRLGWLKKIRPKSSTWKRADDGAWGLFRATRPWTIGTSLEQLGAYKNYYVTNAHLDGDADLPDPVRKTFRGMGALAHLVYINRLQAALRKAGDAPEEVDVDAEVVATSQGEGPELVL